MFLAHPFVGIRDILYARPSLHKAAVGGAGVEDPGDIGMVHDDECLSLLLEAGDDGLGVHAGLDDLEGDALCDVVSSLGEVDDAEAALADDLEEAVWADGVAGLCADGVARGGFGRAGGVVRGMWGLGGHGDVRLVDV